ncbi:YbhB/YbcL family Raf kinase inhibitor-like protein, partial [Candidatus Dojkabacteria bacterium]|nr:YbhB/YbcL family Raf kinase inhibitor-like protein [Candidatus Dojkabacteria bacterium]
ITDFGSTGYGGPCPPSGEHRYYFRAYALDDMLNLDSVTTRSLLDRFMKGHIIADAELMGKYSR